MTGPRETVNFVSRESQYPPRETLIFQGNKINCFPRDQSLSVLLYSTTKTLENKKQSVKESSLQISRCADSQTLSSNHLQSCSVHVQQQSTFASNSALLPSDVMDFAMLPAKRLLTGNSFIVRCHVTLK